MKKLLCILLCLLLPLSALGASTRDMRASALSQEELLSMRAWLDGVVADALPVTYDDDAYVGAYVYSCVEDGGCYVLECDVYLEYGGDTPPEYAIEESLRWLCAATVYVERVEGGFTCVQCDIGDYYQAESYTKFTDEEQGYEVYLPDFFAAHDDDYTYSCYSEDELIAGVTFRSEEYAGSLSDYAAALDEESDVEWLVTVREELVLLTAQSEGAYVVVYLPQDGCLYSLTLTYPAERYEEFTLYAEFMRNSFFVTSIAVG